MRRRRCCPQCNSRFTTYERYEESLLLVVKKDGRRERFERQKVLDGLVRACEKRPVPYNDIEDLALNVERTLRSRGMTEVGSDVIGRQLMAGLRTLDEVAYVRFASVYKEFKDVSRFFEELQALEEYRKRLAVEETDE